MKTTTLFIAAALWLALPAAQAVDIPAGRYLVKPVHSNECLDVSGSTTQLVQKTCTDANVQQQFDISATNSGYSKISSAATGRVVEVTGASNADGAAIGTNTYTGTNAQQFVFLKNASGYVLKSRQSGSCVDLTGFSTSDGALAQQLGCTGAGNQTYVLVASGADAAPIPDGRYQLRVQHSGQCLTVSGAGTANGVPLQQSTCTGTAAQQYDIYYAGASRYEVRNVGSGRCTNLANGSTASGTAVQQYDCNQTGAQRWLLAGTGDGSVQVKSSLDSSKVWEVTGASLTVGASVTLNIGSSGGQQKWTLEPVIYGPNVTEGTYSIKNVNSAKCLIVPGGSTANSVQVQQSTCDGTAPEKFQVLDAGDGYYRILNVNSGLSLHIANFLFGDNAALLQYAPHGGDNQLFAFVVSGSGYLIKPKSTYKCLDVTASSLANGALLQQYTCNQNANQVFQLQ